LRNIPACCFLCHHGARDESGYYAGQEEGSILQHQNYLSTLHTVVQEKQSESLL